MICMHIGHRTSLSTSSTTSFPFSGASDDEGGGRGGAASAEESAGSDFTVGTRAPIEVLPSRIWSQSNEKFTDFRRSTNACIVIGTVVWVGIFCRVKKGKEEKVIVCVDVCVGEHRGDFVWVETEHVRRGFYFSPLSFLLILNNTLYAMKRQTNRENTFKTTKYNSNYNSH